MLIQLEQIEVDCMLEEFQSWCYFQQQNNNSNNDRNQSKIKYLDKTRD